MMATSLRLGVIVISFSLLAVGVPSSVAFGLDAVTALLGALVAYQAYRGYRRNDSRPMLLLAAGVLAITTVSFVFSRLLAPLAPVTAAQVLLVVALLDITGLLAILRSLR